MRILHRLSSDFAELFFRTCRCRAAGKEVFIIIILERFINFAPRE